MSRNPVKREEFLEEVVSSIKCIKESHWMWSVEIIGGVDVNSFRVVEEDI